MESSLVKTKLHPKNWSLICWLLFLIWFAVAVLINCPVIGTLDEIEVPQDGPITLPDGSRAYAYDAVLLETSAGIPISFQRVTKNSSNYSLVAHAANIVIALLNLLALVYCTQTFFGRFSLRAIFGLVTIVALLIAIGQSVFIIEREAGELLFIAAIYFSPFVGVLPAFIMNYYWSK